MSFFLRNALGFFIQLCPCALMIFLPFGQEALRVRRKWIFTGIAFLSAALAAAFPGVLQRTASVWGDVGSGVAANVYMLCAMLAVLAAYLWLVREILLKKVLVFYTVLFYAAAQYYLVLFVSGFYVSLPSYTGVPAYSVYDLMAYAVTAVLLLPLMLAAVIRPLGVFLRETEPDAMGREFSVVIASTTICFALMVYCNTVWRTAFGRAETHISWLLPLSLFMIFDQGVIYALVFHGSVRHRRDSERRQFLEIQRLQYDKISREMEQTRRLRHDLRHHLNVLGALNAQGRQGEITEYLRQYGTVYDRLDRQSFSGDPVVDSLLEYYLARAGEEEVPVECSVSLVGGSGVDAMDMTVLLGNCLENALEALQLLPAQERRLSVEMMPVKSMLLLRIENTCAPAGDSGEFAEWKEFPSHKRMGRYGSGLRSVTAIAEKYGGIAQFQRKDGVFTARVTLNLYREERS